MAHNSIRGSALPKAVAVLAGLGAAAGLALAAPARAASPSTAAARIVAARHHKKPGTGHRRHHVTRQGQRNGAAAAKNR
ncbi:hypothetical protein GCM10023191_010250 [Actinoallomurus oryzae]|uniref:Uncharacterized protein n=1 Tax=Actinoallomurus oryzae TaxID=502180 RepID=A0ABP8PCR3_9ACTN